MLKFEVASRMSAAVLGGYLLAYAFAAGTASALAAGGLLARSDAVVAASMLSFLVYLVAAIYAFAARTAWRAWAWIAGNTVLFGIGAVLFRPAV